MCVCVNETAHLTAYTDALNKVSSPTSFVLVRDDLHVGE